MRTLCAVVLVFEAIVIGLAVPVAIQVSGYSPALAGGLWGGQAVAAFVLSLLQRFRWAYYAGWALQFVFLVSSALMPSLLALAVVFAALWVTGIILAHRSQAARPAEEGRHDHGDSGAAADGSGGSAEA
ncbi:DUF4233 domain-containing protein [Salinactinospora qingdaonensis]|uniref:DUF4233 domain-containing protein n=1 Tax=Salinactinospora qingdaonensis TaxID=702744 RepID=UPI0031E59DF3